MRLDALAGVFLQRIGPETVMFRGQVYRYVIACTFADVFCGAIPLLWDLRSTVLRNLALLAAFAVVLFAFNIFRLSLSDALFAHGVSWNLGHNVVSGFAYFAVWSWLWPHRGWD